MLNAKTGIAVTGGVPRSCANQKVDGQRKKTWTFVLIVMNAKAGIAGIAVVPLINANRTEDGHGNT